MQLFRSNDSLMAMFRTSMTEIITCARTMHLYNYLLILFTKYSTCYFECQTNEHLNSLVN